MATAGWSSLKKVVVKMHRRSSLKNVVVDSNEGDGHSVARGKDKLCPKSQIHQETRGPGEVKLADQFVFHRSRRTRGAPNVQVGPVCQQSQTGIRENTGMDANNNNNDKIIRYISPGQNGTESG